MVYPPDRVAESVVHEKEERHVPEGGGGNFGKYPEGGTVIMASEGYPTKSGYLTFDPGGMSTINRRILDQ